MTRTSSLSVFRPSYLTKTGEWSLCEPAAERAGDRRSAFERHWDRFRVSLDDLELAISAIASAEGRVSAAVLADIKGVALEDLLSEVPR